MADKDDEWVVNPCMGGVQSPVGKVIGKGMEALRTLKPTPKPMPTTPAPPPSKASITRNRDEARQLKQLEALEEGDQFSGR